MYLHVWELQLGRYSNIVTMSSVQLLITSCKEWLKYWEMWWVHYSILHVPPRLVSFVLTAQILHMEKYGHVLVKAFTTHADGPGLEAALVNYKALDDQERPGWDANFLLLRRFPFCSTSRDFSTRKKSRCRIFRTMSWPLDWEKLATSPVSATKRGDEHARTPNWGRLIKSFGLPIAIREMSMGACGVDLLRHFSSFGSKFLK